MKERRDYSFKSLKVYAMSYSLAMQIYAVSKAFPKDEKYSLTDQVRRSSRSVCANIAEGYRKRKYPKHFSSKMSDADAECSETLVWLDFSKDRGYLDHETWSRLIDLYEEVGRMLGGIAKSPEKFSIK